MRWKDDKDPTGSTIPAPLHDLFENCDPYLLAALASECPSTATTLPAGVVSCAPKSPEDSGTDSELNPGPGPGIPAVGPDAPGTTLPEHPSSPTRGDTSPPLPPSPDQWPLTNQLLPMLKAYQADFAQRRIDYRVVFQDSNRTGPQGRMVFKPSVIAQMLFTARHTNQFHLHGDSRVPTFVFDRLICTLLIKKMMLIRRMATILANQSKKQGQAAPTALHPAAPINVSEVTSAVTGDVTSAVASVQADARSSSTSPIPETPSTPTPKRDLAPRFGSPSTVCLPRPSKKRDLHQLHDDTTSLHHHGACDSASDNAEDIHVLTPATHKRARASRS